MLLPQRLWHLLKTLRNCQIGRSRLAFIVFCTLLSLLTLLPATSYAQEQQAILDLNVNLVEQGESIVILRAHDVLLRLADLERAGLKNFSGERITISNQTYVSLASLAPAITYQVDEKALVLRLNAQASLFGAKVLDLRTGRLPDIIYSKDKSAFFNYAFTSQNFQSFSFFGEGGISFNNNLLYSSVTRNNDGKIIRALTNFTINNPSNLTSWVVGDNFASTGNLGGSLFLGGISVYRNFGLNPYFNRQPNFGLSGAVTTPSTVDIYVNGALLRREQLQPGQFELKNIPVPTGSGNARYVIRDAFGREQEINSPFYFAEGLLPVGISEYSYNLGFRRDNLDKSSWDYGSLAFLGRYRAGLTDSLTGGLRLEITPNLASGGGNITAQLPFGQVEVAGAVSQKEGYSGMAGSIAYTYQGQKISFGTSVRAQSQHYANVSLNPLDDRALLEVNAFAGIPLGSGITLSPQYSYSYSRDKGWTNRISLVGNTRLSNKASLFVTGSHSNAEAGGTNNELFIGLNYSFGNNTSGNASIQQRNSSISNSAQIQKSLPVGTGFGYRLQTQTTDEQNLFNGQLQYQGPYGRYEANFQRTSEQNTTTLTATGGIVTSGGKVFFTRPVQSSFALVQVPGVAGVRAYLSNQEVGRTDKNGNLIVPDLIPYYGNQLRIADQDIPLNYSISTTEKVVAPPVRGGAVVRFAVQKNQNFTGTVVLEVSGKTVIPAYGQLSVIVDGKQVVSPLGKEGEFYLENLASGRYEAQVESKDGVCKLQLNAPTTDKPFVNLGELHCVLP